MTKLNNNVNIYGAALRSVRGRKSFRSMRNGKNKRRAAKGKAPPKGGQRRTANNPMRKPKNQQPKTPRASGYTYNPNPNSRRGRGINGGDGKVPNQQNNFTAGSVQENRLAAAMNATGSQDVTKSNTEVVVARNGTKYKQTNYQTPRIHKPAAADPAEIGAIAPEIPLGEGQVLTFKGRRLRSGNLPYVAWQQPLAYMAQGWYAALRKAYIKIGPASLNDKYAPPKVDPFKSHSAVIGLMYDVLRVCYDNIRAGKKKLDFNIPEHLSFAVNVLALKQLQATSTGIVDHAELSGQTYDQVITTYEVEVDYLEGVIALPANPFKMTDTPLTESNISVYHDPSGKAIHSTMKIQEIASIYGYAINNVEDPSLTFVAACFNYDYSGLSSPSSTQLFRSSFFTRYNKKSDLIVDNNFNPVLLPNQWVDPGMVMFNYAVTGFVPTSEFTYPGTVPLPFAVTDIAAKLTKSAGLEYLQKRCANGPPTAVTPDFLAYNCALDLAKALQTKNNNFYFPGNVEGLPVILEEQWSYAISVAQFVEKIVLPSPIFEELKVYNDINSWTYVGKPEPRAIYFQAPSVFLTILSANDDPKQNMTLATYYDKVKLSAKYLSEIRYYVKLNFAPELNNYMPNLHLFLQGNDGKIYSVLDLESFKHKDIGTWLNYSLIPQIKDDRPVALTYIEVKRTPTYDEALSNLYQFAFDASYNGKSSELDFYYARLREKQIGFMGALASMLGTVLPMVPSMVSTIFHTIQQNKKTNAGGKTHAATSTGALVQSTIKSIMNQFDDKQVAVNAPNQKVPVKGGAIAAHLLGQAAKSFFL